MRGSNEKLTESRRGRAVLRTVLWVVAQLVRCRPGHGLVRFVHVKPDGRTNPLILSGVLVGVQKKVDTAFAFLLAPTRHCAVLTGHAPRGSAMLAARSAAAFAFAVAVVSARPSPPNREGDTRSQGRSAAASRGVAQPRVAPLTSV